MGYVIGTLITVVIIFAIGFATTSGGGTSNKGNANVDGCAAACSNLISKRAQTCAHRAAVAAATATRNSYATLVASAAAAAVAAAAAAAAAIFTPIVGPIIAPILAAASAAAWAYLDFVLGQLAGASAALQVQIDGLNEATTLEAEATTLVQNACAPDVAQNCIASLPACAV